MDNDEFRVRGREMVEFICRYLECLPERRVVPSVEPGYLKHLIPKEAPEQGESWDDIMADVESKIMPGVTHWQHPRFHAYFPSGNSFPSILGDMLSDAIGCIGFSWAASPACTELETIVVDWLGKAIGLPVDFLAFAEGSKGGGVIQTSASECVLVCMLAARAQAIKRLKQQEPGAEEGLLLGRLMAYCSKESHSCVEKAAMISFVKLRILEPDHRCSLRGHTLRQAMEEDEAAGLVPFFVSTTLGTTSCCSFDNLMEIGPVCRRFPCVWLHVDGAYAGNSFICPELKVGGLPGSPSPPRCRSGGAHARPQPLSAATHAGRAVRRLVQHQPQQVAAHLLRLLLPVGARPAAAHVRAGRGPALPPARLLRGHHRLPALGGAAEPPLPRAQTLVRHADLRHRGPAPVHPPPHQAGQDFRGQGAQGSALRGLQRGEARPRLLPPPRLGPAQHEAAEQHQRLGPAAHGARHRARQVHHPVLRHRPERHGGGRRPRLGRDHRGGGRTAGGAQRGGAGGHGRPQAARDARLQALLLRADGVRPQDLQPQDRQGRAGPAAARLVRGRHRGHRGGGQRRARDREHQQHHDSEAHRVVDKLAAGVPVPGRVRRGPPRRGARKVPPPGYDGAAQGATRQLLAVAGERVWEGRRRQRGQQQRQRVAHHAAAGHPGPLPRVRQRPRAPVVVVGHFLPAEVAGLPAEAALRAIGRGRQRRPGQGQEEGQVGQGSVADAIEAPSPAAAAAGGSGSAAGSPGPARGPSPSPHHPRSRAGRADGGGLRAHTLSSQASAGVHPVTIATLTPARIRTHSQVPKPILAWVQHGAWHGAPSLLLPLLLLLLLLPYRGATRRRPRGRTCSCEQ